jgi:hypothetical protein
MNMREKVRKGCGGWAVAVGLGGWLMSLAAPGAITLPSPSEDSTSRPPRLAVPPPREAEAPAPATPPPRAILSPEGIHPLRLRLDLRDGSRIIGAPASTNFNVRAAVGSITLDWSRLASCQRQERKESMTFIFRNGDQVTGVIGLEAFHLTTCLGLLKVPLAEVNRVGVIPAASGAAVLLNVNFASTNKTGQAALGLGDDDFWNSYVAPFAPLASVENLKYSNGETTGAGLIVANGGGHWGNKSGDPMYDSYAYPNSHTGNVTVTLTNLPPGAYDFCLYGHADPGGNSESDSIFTLRCGAREYGPAGTRKSGAWKATEPWVEGLQYVLLKGVEVGPGEDVVITVAPGFDGQPSGGVAVINGLQIAPAGLLAPTARPAP